MGHKHKLKLRSTIFNSLLVKTECVKCGQKFAYLKTVLYPILLRGGKYQPTFLMGHF